MEREEMKLVFARLTCRVRAGAPPKRTPPVRVEVEVEVEVDDGRGHYAGPVSQHDEPSQHGEPPSLHEEPVCKPKV